MREHDKHHSYPANCQKIETFRNLKETTFVLITSMGFLIHMQDLRPCLFLNKNREVGNYRDDLLIIKERQKGINKSLTVITLKQYTMK